MSGGDGRRPAWSRRALVGLSARSALPRALLLSFAVIFFQHDAPSVASTDKDREIKMPRETHPLTTQVVDPHGFVTSADGTCLFYRFWPSHESGNARFVALVLHGIGYHSGPYRVIAEALNLQGINIYAMDARRHGLSCGSRGRVPTAVQAQQDIKAMLQRIIQDHRSAKLFLIGESMGGAFALAFAADGIDIDIAGMVLIAPAVQVRKKQFLRFSNLLLLPDIVFRPDKPAVSLVDKRLDESSRDRAFIQARRADHLAYDKVSVNYLRGIGRLMNNWKTRIAPKIRVPVLIVHGAEDPIISVSGSKSLYRFLRVQDKALCIYQDVPHTVLWDPKTPQILTTIARWIVER